MGPQDLRTLTSHAAGSCLSLSKREGREEESELWLNMPASGGGGEGTCWGGSPGGGGGRLVGFLTEKSLQNRVQAAEGGLRGVNWGGPGTANQGHTQRGVTGG